MVLVSRWALAQDGAAGALSGVNLSSATTLGPLLGSRLAIADFDGDSKLDGAVLVDAELSDGPRRLHKIDLHFTGHANSEITFESPETELAISAYDIDNDGRVDIVAERLLTRQRIEIWLNKGDAHFKKGRVEDFASSGTVTSARLESPAPEQDASILFLAPSYSTGVSKLTICLLAGRPPSGDRFEFEPNASSLAASPESMPWFSRAPPLPQLI